MRPGRRGVVAALLAAAVAPAFAPGASAARAAQQVAGADGSVAVRDEQLAAGLPVLGGGRVTLRDASGRRSESIDTRVAVVAPARRTPAVTEGAAVDIARVAAGGGPLRQPAAARLALLPADRLGQEARLVWDVQVAAADPLRDDDVTVDAISGTVIGVDDRLRRLTGSGAVFDPNPVVEHGSRAGLADNGDADSPLLTSLRRIVALGHLDSGICLNGRWVRAVLPAGDACAPGLDFTPVTRADDRFEAVMGYFHIDRAHARLAALGFGSILDRPIVFHADDVPDTNAYYSPATKDLHFGTGGVDKGEDADIITHEYGHAVQDDEAAHMSGVQGDALAEGWADYFSEALSAQTESDPFWVACWSEWGFAEPSELCTRRGDTPLRLGEVGFGTPCNWEPHCAGQVWASTLNALRAQIGGDTFDRIALESNVALPIDPLFEDAGRALVAADEVLDAGAHRAAIVAELRARGILEGDDTPPDAPLLGIPGAVENELGLRSDRHDVYAVDLVAGRGVRLELAGGVDADLRVLHPGTTDVDEDGAGVAGAASTGGAAAVSYVPAVTGRHYIDVAARAGSGAYTLRVVSDRDGDGRPDASDSCPDTADPGHEDRDGDGRGDACDPFPDDPADDADHDGRPAPQDRCPAIADNGTDSDRDGRPDACDPFPADPADDADGDGADATTDNCPGVANPDQADWDGDGRGDACDRSAALGLRAVVRRRTVGVTATLRPASVDPRQVRLTARRRLCVHRRCRWGQARTLTLGAAPGGTATATASLARGRWQLTGALRDRRYFAVDADPVTVVVR